MFALVDCWLLRWQWCVTWLMLLQMLVNVLVCVCVCEGATEPSGRASGQTAADAVSSDPVLQTAAVQSTSPWRHRVRHRGPRRHSTAALRRSRHWPSTAAGHQPLTALWHHSLTPTATTTIHYLLDTLFYCCCYTTITLHVLSIRLVRLRAETVSCTNELSNILSNSVLPSEFLLRI